jgi:hypothetical protein
LEFIRSARARELGKTAETLRPSALAVFRLTTNSNLVGWEIARLRAVEDLAHKARCSEIKVRIDASDSPMGLAPPFRDLSKRYAIENLAEALAEGIVTGHPAMPRFTFDPREIEALLTFIASLTPSAEHPSRRR